MWGLVPAAGAGSRIQPLAFSKELLPVGSRLGPWGERPRAVSEYLVDRMLAAGADRICFVISPGKSDIMAYFGGEVGGASVAYVVQPEPAGLCDALFRAAPLIGPGEQVLIGLPDTIWYPENGFALLEPDRLSFLLFPVEHPQFFDAVVTDSTGAVNEIQVKVPQPRTNWIWGALRLPAAVFHALHRLWREPARGDEYLGTLVNAYLARGGEARAVAAGEAYVDVGTFHGYHEAIALLDAHSCDAPRFAVGARARPKAVRPAVVAEESVAAATPGGAS
ncbi:MAG: nucleotidyltransferase family protein [Opitutaceae bacterium]